MSINFMFGAVSNIWQKMNGYYRSHIIYDYVADNKRVLLIKPWQIDNFFKIIDEDLDKFLEYDRCYRLADNYLIAMVFVYFIRADLEVEEYTAMNFLVALHLALAMEEDDEGLLRDLQLWLDSIDESLDNLQMHKILFQRVGYRGTISRTCCENVMRKINPNHEVWTRQRHINHSGAVSNYRRKGISCPRCT